MTLRYKYITSALFVVGFFFLFMPSALALCTVFTLNQCDVCANPQEKCVQDFDGSAICYLVPGQCGAPSGDECNVLTVGQCNICPGANEKCVMQDGSAACEIVPGQCGATQTTCGSPGTQGECGDAGSCSNPSYRCDIDPGIGWHCVFDPACNPGGPPPGQICANNTIGQCDVCPDIREKCVLEQGNPTPVCKILPGQCGVPTGVDCGDPGTIGQCGATGGCSNADEICETAGNCVHDNECTMTDPPCRTYGQTCGSSTPIGANPNCCNPDENHCTANNAGIFVCGDPWIPPDGQLPPPPPIATYSGPIIDFEGLLAALFSFLLPVAIGLIGIPLALSNSYKIMTSQGDPAKKKDGFEGLLSAILGTTFVLLAYSIIRLMIISFFGVTI